MGIFSYIDSFQLKKELMIRPYTVLSENYYENVDKNNRYWENKPVSYDKYRAARLRYERLQIEYKKCCFPACDAETFIKCNSCQH